MTTDGTIQKRTDAAAITNRYGSAASPGAGADPVLTPAVEHPANSVYVLGTAIANLDMPTAVGLIETSIKTFRAQPSRSEREGSPAAPGRSLYIVNAHTLNLTCEDPSYRAVIAAANYVFGDGTGVRWAARRRGKTMAANLVGTDLLPELFAATAGRGYRYYLLGADAASIELAARHCRSRFAGWDQAGFHHGYIAPADLSAVIDAINQAAPDVLLVGMGNPLQERWIHDNLGQLEVPLAIGVGGLFDHWAGNLQRAPRWVRALGCEWAQLLLQQPKKWRRYLLGNPLFILRMLTWQARDRRATQAPPDRSV